MDNSLGDGLVPFWRPPQEFGSSSYVRLDARPSSALAGSTPSGPGASSSLLAANAGVPVVASSKRKAGASLKPKGDLVVKKMRAVRRAQRPAPGGDLITAAESASVAKATQATYEANFEEFKRWAYLRGNNVLKLKDVEKLDELLVVYLDEVLYASGEDAGKAKSTVFGTIFCKGLPKGPGTFPRSRRALTGFGKDTPATSKDPAPIEAVAILAEHLFNLDELLPVLSGLALLVGFDLFLRPSETLGITAKDVVAPQRGRYQGVSVMISQSELKNNRVGGGKPAKSGEFDDTVLAGLKGLHLEWIPEVLLSLRQGLRPAQLLLGPLSLAQYDATVKTGLKDLLLEELCMTPHSVRHGGPSLAALEGLLDAKGIQKRGRWLAPRSVRRYEKTGKLTRQAALLGRGLMSRAEKLLKPKSAGSLKQLALAAAKRVKYLRKLRT